MDCSTPGLPVHHQLPEFTQTHVHRVSDAIQPSHPLSSLLLLPSVFPSIRVFSSESALHIRWPKYWSFSFSINPSNEYSELISFRRDWLDLLAVQGSLKGLLQHNCQVSILQHSAFFMIQLSHPYMTTGKTTAFLLSLKYKNSNVPYRFSTFTTGQREKCLKVARCFTNTSGKRSPGRTDEWQSERDIIKLASLESLSTS